MRFRSRFGVGSKNCGRGSEITKKKKTRERERGGTFYVKCTIGSTNLSI